jgi:outer membrane protein assembly factor BamE (lipoprotein component of BamABCDE complex)
MKLPAWIATAATALCAALLPACDSFNLNAIHPGTTTAAEVRDRLGPPGYVHWHDDGTLVWEYSRQPAGIHCYMISFDQREVVSRVEQVLSEANYARVQPGMRHEDIRRLFGVPANKTVFANLGEEVWEWHVEGSIPTEDTRFMVHFDLDSGRVRKTSKMVVPRG